MPTPQSAYWSQTRSLTYLLLGIWLLATFIVTYFARSLAFTFLGWPFPFYMAAQGSLLVYLLIVYLYARLQHRRDAAFGVSDPRDE